MGFNKAAHKATANLGLDVDNPFCAVTLSALDGRPIAESRQLLLTTTARVANSHMKWNAGRTTLEKWGDPPACIEPVTGKVLLRNLASATSVRAQPLDGAGSPLGAPLDATKTADGWQLAIGNPPTTWYVISLER